MNLGQTWDVCWHMIADADYMMNNLLQNKKCIDWSKNSNYTWKAFILKTNWLKKGKFRKNVKNNLFQSQNNIDCCMKIKLCITETTENNTHKIFWNF